jgi:hypothetical protein
MLDSMFTRTSLFFFVISPRGCRLAIAIMTGREAQGILNLGDVGGAA